MGCCHDGNVSSVAGASGWRLLCRLRVTLDTGSGRALVVVSPELFLLRAQKIQIVPGENASVMAVRKLRLHGIIPHRFERIEFHHSLAGLQYFLSRPMAL